MPNLPESWQGVLPQKRRAGLCQHLGQRPETETGPQNSGWELGNPPEKPIDTDYSHLIFSPAVSRSFQMTTKEILSTFHLGMQAAPTPSLPSQSSAPVAKGGEKALRKPRDQVTALLRCCMLRVALRTGTLGQPRTPRQARRPRECRERGRQEPGARARGFPCRPGSPGRFRPPDQHGRHIWAQAAG